MTSDGRELDIGREGPQLQNILDRSFAVLYCWPELQMFMQSRVLVLASKKPAFKLSAYIFEYGPLPPTSNYIIVIANES